MNSNKITSFLLLSAVVISCTRPDKCLSPVQFPSGDQPCIYIQQPHPSKKPCTYSVTTRFYTNEGDVTSYGSLVFEDLKFKVKMDSTEGEAITFFDFTKHVGDTYHLPLKIGSRKEVMTMRLENIIDTPFSNKVYQFRLLDGFTPASIHADVVFFADMKRGIIGSYISDVEENQEIIVAPRGNILRDSLDYSNKQFKRLE